LAGDSAEINVLFCLWPGDEAVTSATERIEWPPPLFGRFSPVFTAQPQIAAQCCAPSTLQTPHSGDCRRRATRDGSASGTDDDCVAGQSPEAAFAPDGRAFPPRALERMTYGDTVARCGALGLRLCRQSCAHQGCFYDMHPVYSALPCAR